MWRAFFEGSALLDLPVMAMWLFFATFVFTVGRAILRRSTADDAIAHLPLEDDAFDVEENLHV